MPAWAVPVFLCALSFIWTSAALAQSQFPFAHVVCRGERLDQPYDNNDAFALSGIFEVPEGYDYFSRHDGEVELDFRTRLESVWPDFNGSRGAGCQVMFHASYSEAQRKLGEDRRHGREHHDFFEEFSRWSPNWRVILG